VQGGIWAVPVQSGPVPTAASDNQPKNRNWDGRKNAQEAQEQVVCLKTSAILVHLSAERFSLNRGNESSSFCAFCVFLWRSRLRNYG
jgi:hypothetical protein